MTRILTSWEPLFLPLPWTVERYHSAIAAGVLTEDDRAELIEGQIAAKMPIGELHAACVAYLREFLSSMLSSRYHIRTENPITLPPDSEPEPDLAIVDADPMYYASGHPVVDQVHLIVEVADSTLLQDRSGKLPMYASHGIKEYWIVNIKERLVEVYLEPNGDGLYLNARAYQIGDSFESPLVGQIAVSQILLLVG